MLNLRLIAAAGLLAAVALAAGQVPPSAEAIMKEATTKAAKDQKAVWVLFHASW